MKKFSLPLKGSILGFIFLFCINVFSLKFFGGLKAIKELSLLLMMNLTVIFVLVFNLKKFLFSFLMIKSMNSIDAFFVLFLLYSLFHLCIVTDVSSKKIEVIEIITLLGLYSLIRMKLVGYKNLFNLLIIAAIIQCCIGLLQLYGIINSFSSLGISGTFWNPAPFAMCIATVLPFAFYKIAFDNSKIADKRLSFALVILSILVLPVTLNRTSWAMCFVSIVVIVYLKYSKYLINIWKKFRLILILSGSAFILCIGIMLYNLKPESANGRFFVWKVAISKIVEKPFFGYGYRNFHVLYNNWQADWFRNNGIAKHAHEVQLAGNVQYAYNVFLEVFAELGLIGLLIFLALIVVILRKTQLLKTDTCKVLGVFLVTVFIGSLFSYTLQIYPIRFLFFLCIPIVANALSDELYENKSFGSSTVKVLSPLLFTSALYMFFILVTVFEGRIQWKIADNKLSSGNISSALRSYAENYKCMKHDGKFLQYYGNALVLNKSYDVAGKILLEAREKSSDMIVYTMLGDTFKNLGKVDEAEKAYLHASFMVPHKLYPNYLLAKLYKDSQQNDKACQMAYKVINMRPKVKSIAVNEIKKEMEDILKL